MSEFIAELSPFFQWLLKSTTQASVLVCLILTFQLLFAKRLGLRWHYCLWMLLIVRMLMPWSPQSKVSVYNLVPEPGQVKTTFEHITQKSFVINNDITGEPTATPLAVGKLKSKPVHQTKAAPESIPAANGQSVSEQPSSSLSVDAGFVLRFVWAVGAGLLTCIVFAGNFRLWRIIKSKRPVTDQKVLEMLEDCKAQMGIETVLAIVETKRVQSPALFGFVRPRLLLPAGMLKSLTPQELEHIFLHELAHLKRFDIYLGWVMAVLQILHWFNPMVWFAFYRIRIDRELACDGLALSTMGTDQPNLYGQTIVSLLERFSHQSRLPSMAGILEDKSQIKRRITSIAKFKKSAYKWSPLAVLTIVVLSFVTLSDAHNTKGSEPGFLIKGTVTDAVSGEPIAGVRVGDDGYAGGQQWTITDSQGRYSYPTWYEEHGIKAEADSYNSERKTFLTKLFGSAKEKTINFELRPEAMGLPYKASLPDGVSVELVGVAEHPSKGKKWWKPDGSELAGNPWDGINSRISISPMPGRKAYEIAVLINYEEGNEPGNYVYSEHSKNAAHSNANKSSTSEMSCSVLDMPGDKEVTHIKLGIASGKYETRYSRKMPLHGTYVRRPDEEGKGISWFAPVAVGDETSITITHGYAGDQTRVIAIDSEGTEHFGGGSGGSIDGKTWTMQYTLKVPLDRIKEFVFQTRPYKRYEFKNVALRPGAKGGLQKDIAINVEARLIKCGDGFLDKINIHSGRNVKAVELSDQAVKDIIRKAHGLKESHVLTSPRVLVLNNEQASMAISSDHTDSVRMAVTPSVRHGRIFLDIDCAVMRGDDSSKAEEVDLSSVLKAKITVDDGGYAAIPMAGFDNEEMLFLVKASSVALQEKHGTQANVLPAKGNELILFAVTRSGFMRGDSIEISSVTGTSPKIEVGETYTVTGRYNLASHDRAILHVYATNGEVLSDQGPKIAKGSGEFSRTFKFIKEGWLHLSFYPADGGSSFGNLYFANAGTDAENEREKLAGVTFDFSRVSGSPSVGKASGDFDIAASDFRLRYDESRGTHNLLVSIVNNSNVTIPQFKVRYYKGDIADNLNEAGRPYRTDTDWHNAGPIEPGKKWGERTRDFHLPNGEYTFGVVLDYDNAIDESDESNNTEMLGAVVVDGKVIKAEHKQIEMKRMSKERMKQDPICRSMRKSIVKVELILAGLMAKHGKDHPEVHQTRDVLKQAKADLKSRQAEIARMVEMKFSPEQKSKTTATPEIQIETGVREIYLPNFDGDVHQILDFDSGELVDFPEIKDDFELFGAMYNAEKGDFVFDVNEGRLRCAWLYVTSQMDGTKVIRTVSDRFGFFWAGEGDRFPPTQTIMTRGGNQYKVQFGKIDEKGCVLKYYPLSNAKARPAGGSSDEVRN
ncbi:MAG: hypothetical protein KAJ07_09425 [Planctomycetes bacterium]|nr:hypothetical protein [Planctomycetota bacterium]